MDNNEVLNIGPFVEILISDRPSSKYSDGFQPTGDKTFVKADAIVCVENMQREGVVAVVYWSGDRIVTVYTTQSEPHLMAAIVTALKWSKTNV